MSEPEEIFRCELWDEGDYIITMKDVGPIGMPVGRERDGDVICQWLNTNFPEISKPPALLALLETIATIRGERDKARIEGARMFQAAAAKEIAGFDEGYARMILGLSPADIVKGKGE